MVEFSKGCVTKFYDDYNNNNEEGYSNLEEARRKAEELEAENPLRGGGTKPIQGVEAKIYDWKGNRAIVN